MNTSDQPSKRQILMRLRVSIGRFLRSPAGGKALLMLSVLIVLMLGINAMNVANSFVGRYFMSAIEGRDTIGFIHFAWSYVAVFAGSTLLAVLFRFTEERLGLLWREWLTHRVTGVYLDQRLYLDIAGEPSLSNLDQRMTEDVKQLTTSTLSFILMISNATITVLSFSGVLWTISPRLFLIAVLYALTGSAMAIWLGRPLIRLNYRQSDFEADLRSELIRLREEGPVIVATGGEPGIRDRLNALIDSLVANIRRITDVNRNLNFFTTGYNYLIQLIPVLIVAPLFIGHQVEFGVIGQSAMAFATLVGAFSLIITQFQAISSYASVMVRLSELVGHAEAREAQKPYGKA